jgi:hypothetical protein
MYAQESTLHGVLCYIYHELFFICFGELFPIFSNFIITVWPKHYFQISVFIALCCMVHKKLLSSNVTLNHKTSKTWFSNDGDVCWVNTALLLYNFWFQSNFQHRSVGVEYSDSEKLHWLGLSRAMSWHKDRNWVFRDSKGFFLSAKLRNIMISWKQFLQNVSWNQAIYYDLRENQWDAIVSLLMMFMFTKHAINPFIFCKVTYFHLLTLVCGEGLAWSWWNRCAYMFASVTNAFMRMVQ